MDGVTASLRIDLNTVANEIKNFDNLVTRRVNHNREINFDNEMINRGVQQYIKFLEGIIHDTTNEMGKSTPIMTSLKITLKDIQGKIDLIEKNGTKNTPEVVKDEI